MSEEELEQVAGGNAQETSNGSRFINSLNGSTDRYGPELSLAAVSAKVTDTILTV